MKKTSARQIIVDLENHHKQANEQQFAILLEAIHQLMPVMNTFRQHNYVGVPCARKLSIQGHTISKEIPTPHDESAFIRLQGKWLNALGFMPGSNVQILGLKGLLILSPEDFSSLDQARATVESELLFGKIEGVNSVRMNKPLQVAESALRFG